MVCTLLGEDSFEKVLDAPEEKNLRAEIPALKELLARARA